MTAHADYDRFSDIAVRELSSYLVVLDKLCCWPKQFDTALDAYGEVTGYKINGVLRLCELNDRSHLLNFLHWKLNEWWYEQICCDKLPNIQAWMFVCGDTNNPPSEYERSPIIDFAVQYKFNQVRRLNFKRLTLAEIDAVSRSLA